MVGVVAGVWCWMDWEEREEMEREGKESVGKSVVLSCMVLC